MHHWRPLALAAVVWIASACHGGSSEKAQEAAPGKCDVSATAAMLVTGPGPFHVGYRKYPVTYQPPAGEPERTITVNVWYPTNETGGQGTVYLGLFNDDNSQVDATPAPPLSSCGYPTIAYSHGYQGLAGGAAQMMRYFASHGWVAVAPDHTQNTLTDNVKPTLTALYFERSLDISQSIDSLTKFQAPDPLANKIATDKVLLVGHSFGTHTVWASAGATFDVDVIKSNCQPGGKVPSGVCTDAELAEFGQSLRDPRIVAGIPMAGVISRDWFGPNGHESVKIPLLQMTGSANDVGQGPEWDTLGGVDISWIELAGGCHETFNLGICDTLDVQLGFSIVDTYALAFARYHVLGDRDPTVVGIVNGTVQVSDKVTFKKR